MRTTIELSTEDVLAAAKEYAIRHHKDLHLPARVVVNDALFYNINSQNQTVGVRLVVERRAAR